MPQHTTMPPDRRPKAPHKHCLQPLLGVKMASRETENNAHAKLWGDKQRTPRHDMVFSGVANKIIIRFGFRDILSVIIKVKVVVIGID